MKSKSREVGRNTQLERALKILFDLMRTGGGLSLEELATSHGSHARTIQRDLDALKAAGLPLESDVRNKRKYWRIDTAGTTRRLHKLWDKAHYLAICVAMGSSATLHRNLGVFTWLEDLQDKIEGALGTRAREQLAATVNAFYSYEKHAYTQAQPAMLWSLISAIAERQICVVTYRKPQHDSVDKSFDILPLKVFAHQGAAYLMCHVVKHDAIGTLNLQRIRSLKPTDRRGEVPAHFDPGQLELSAFGVHTGAESTRYVLEFAPDVAGYIRERTWHPNQELRELPGGGIQLAFECGRSFEVSAWVASWRHHVTVVEPDSLRQELRELGESLVMQYRDADREKRP